MDLPLIISFSACLLALLAAVIVSARAQDRLVSVTAFALVFSALIPLVVLPEFFSSGHSLLSATLFVQSTLMLIALIALWRIEKSRKRAESGRRQTELQFQTLVENMPDGFRINKDGITVYANRRFCEMLGYEQAEVVGHSADMIFFKDERFDTILEQRQLRAKGQSGSYEMELRRKDGSELPTILSVQPIFNAKGEFVASCGVFTDISTRQEAEKELRASEQRFRDYAQAASDIFWELDEELRFSMVAESGGGPFLGAAHGEPWLDLLTRETLGDSYDQHREDLASQKPFRGLRYSYRDESGRSRHWRLSGRPFFSEDGLFLGYRGTATEVTAEVDATHQAAKAQSVLLSALNSMSDALAVFDDEDRLVLFNKRCAEIYTELTDVLKLGVSFEEIIRNGIQRRIYEHDCSSHEEYLQLRMERHRNPGARFVQRLQGNRWVQITESRMKNGGTVGVWTDVTELKRREQELLQAQKMEAVGQLTGGIAHDFNNLLAVVLGNLELLQSLLVESPKVETYVSRAITAARRGAALTQRLLSFSRKQRLQPTSTDVEKLICAMTELIRGTLGEAIEIQTEFESHLPFAMVDPHQLETALLNLALNGRDAMHSEGILRIECRKATLPRSKADEEIRQNAQQTENDHYVRIDVIDTGEGVSAEAQARIFEPFYTTKEVGRGSGLGLSMVYGFVKQSGGHIQFESEIGQGTCVSIYLPIAETTLEDLERVDQETALPESRGERILLVEDDSGVRELTRVLLEEFGYAVSCAETAADALEVFTAEPEFDLLLSDVVLTGGKSGFELAKDLQARSPELAILFFSGYSQHPIVGSLPSSMPLLQKPFRKVELARKLREVLEAQSRTSPSANARGASQVDGANLKDETVKRF